MLDEPTAPEVKDRSLLPDQVTMGLLAYLTAHAVDEDYAQAAARRGTEPARRSPRRIGVAGAVAIAVFAVLAVTAAVQTSQDSASQERERLALIAQVQAAKALLESERKTVAGLQAQIDRLEQVRNASSSGGVLSELSLLALRSGTSAVHGPGVELVIDDAVGADSDRFKVLDSDLQGVVNGLWRAGAEAISINGERLTNLSAIRHATGITVNFRSLSRPYRILAIGDPKSLPERFLRSASGQAWFDAQRQVGLRYSMHTQKSLRLPAARVPELRFAQTTTVKGNGLS